jgi:hypothetical protein
VLLCETACEVVTRPTRSPSCNTTGGLTGSPCWRLRKTRPGPVLLSLPSFAPQCECSLLRFARTIAHCVAAGWIADYARWMIQSASSQFFAQVGLRWLAGVAEP